MSIQKENSELADMSENNNVEVCSKRLKLITLIHTRRKLGHFLESSHIHAFCGLATLKLYKEVIHSEA